MKTFDESVRAIADFGFTPRQARFLVLVMRHSGLCLVRQYSAFAGIAHGQKSRVFFERLVRRGYASACECVHNRARLYHVHHKALYRVIGDPESRLRRTIPAHRVVDRIMLLDALLASPAVTWFATAEEKVEALVEANAREPETSPEAPADEPSPAIRERLPVGIDQDGRLVFLFLVTTPIADECELFVQQRAEQLRTLSGWTVRLVLAPPADVIASRYRATVEDVLRPIDRATLEKVQWYFSERPMTSEGHRPLHPIRFYQVSRDFGTARFRWLYRRWLKEGESVFRELSSPVLAEALERGDGRVECQVLTHRYHHLSPLVRPRRSETKGAEKVAVPREEALAPVSAPSQKPLADAIASPDI